VLPNEEQKAAFTGALAEVISVNLNVEGDDKAFSITSITPGSIVVRLLLTNPAHIAQLR
jgi:hypothetical protein